MSLQRKKIDGEYAPKKPVLIPLPAANMPTGFLSAFLERAQVSVNNYWWYNPKEDTLGNLLMVFMAEMLGSLVFGFIGVGTLSALAMLEGMFHLDLYNILLGSWAFGFGLMAGLLAFADMGALCLNPATAFATFLINKITALRLVVFWVAELIGWILAGAFVYSLIPAYYKTAAPWPALMGLTTLNTHFSIGLGIWVETALSIFLNVILLFGVIKPIPIRHSENYFLNFKNFRPVMIIAAGFGYAGLMFVGHNATGASMNPFRSLGPAIVAAQFDYIGIYFAGPFAGAVIAALLWYASYWFYVGEDLMEYISVPRN